MTDTHDDGRPDAERGRTPSAGDAQAAPAYAPADGPGAAYPAGSYPGASYPGGPYPAGPYPATHPGAVPPPGYGMVLLPPAHRPLPAHIDPAWRLAGVGRRAAGRILDQVVFGVVGGLSASAFIIPIQGMAQQRINDLQLFGEAADDMMDTYFGGAVLATSISLLAYLLIATWWLGWKGTTPGKAMVGIRVQRFSAPGMLGFGRALLRGVVQNAFVLGWIFTVWLPYASVGWDSRHLLRGWHDLAADDVVLARRTESFGSY
ncbi:RDD family protein [Clavibacter michiganensis]|uniref:RDD family protein n=1 Tax=Clavibacter michiganensis TaxID=28447 RepID=A0A251YNV4_9MICO|nr:RDD family protein [Clavibacter michiganensis]OUE25915.1 RDD family protein [Clavibacter michiganensis]